VKKAVGWHKVSFIYAWYFIFKHKLKADRYAYMYYFWADNTGFSRVRKCAFEKSRFKGWYVLHGGSLASQRQAEPMRFRSS